MRLSSNGQKRSPYRTVPCCLAISAPTSSKSRKCFALTFRGIFSLVRFIPLTGSSGPRDSHSLRAQCKLHGLSQVNRSAARGLEYLLSTAEPIRNDEHVRIRLPNCG